MSPELLVVQKREREKEKRKEGGMSNRYSQLKTFPTAKAEAI